MPQNAEWVTEWVTAARHTPFPAGLSRGARHELLAPLNLPQSSSSTWLHTRHGTARPSSAPGTAAKPRGMVSIFTSSITGTQGAVSGQLPSQRLQEHQGLLQPPTGR